MRARRWAGWSVLVLAVLAAAGAFLPLPPKVLSNVVDQSFGQTLHLGAARGYAVGSELISTFGPLGFVFYPTYLPATLLWLVALRLALAAATIWTFAWIGLATLGSPLAAGLLLLACAPFVAPPDVWFMLLPLLAVFVELFATRAAPVSLRITLGAAIGLACLIKFTFLIAVLAVLGPLTLASLRARRVPLVTSAALGAAAIAWLATGHGLAALLLYLDLSTREIAAGYGGAMQGYFVGSLLVHALVVTLVLIAAGVLFARRLATGRWAAPAALAAVVFLLFKAGFVRADVHVFTTVFGFLVLTVLLALQWARRPRGLALGALGVALVAGGFWVHAAIVRGWPFLYFPPVFPPEAFERLASLSLLWHREALDAQQAVDDAALREETPLPSLRGTVDVYPYEQNLILAHALDLRPRPVFQSYMAYTPRLAQANADHLESELAPEWIVFRVAPIDKRMPTMDDSASWPLFLTRYKFQRPVEQYALLRRREAPRRWHLESLGTVDSNTGTKVDVPSEAGPIWARIDLHETWSDGLAGLLVAPRLVYLGIGMRKGKAEAYRFVPKLGRGGFLLSPLVEDTSDFIKVMENPGQRTTNDVVWLKLRTPSGTELDRTMTVEFFRLVIEG